MLETKVFRIFVSSTFRDLKLERDVLQERVFPELRAYCAERGYTFQAVDLRWGIRDEAVAGHRTMRICLSEVARCQEVTPRPNFVVLLGSRYGWRPLPEVVDAAEFETLTLLLASADAAAAEAAYIRDDNAVPPQYVLRVGDEGDSYDPDSLREALAEAARSAKLPAGELAKYTLSATEQEILKGAFEAEHADEHAFCFMRDLGGLPNHVSPDSGSKKAQPPEADYRDFLPDGTVDDKAEVLLDDLKSRLKKLLGDTETRQAQGLGNHVFEYSATWDGAGPSTGHVDQLCVDMLESLKRVIDSEIERLGAVSHLERERVVHDAFASERASGFVGRIRYLDSIAQYLARHNSHPLCVVGGGGLGKSALLARATTDARATRPTAVVVTRFVGVTSASANSLSLLQDLCTEIGEAYRSTGPIPSTLQELQQEFTKRLALASADHPLIVFLDALDQLSGQGSSLAWLPLELPAHVRIVTTSRLTTQFDTFSRRLPAGALLELEAMPLDEGDQLLQNWLDGAARTLTPAQRAEILGHFAECGSPLYLALAFEQARLWPSTLAEVRIGADVPSVIGDLFDRLEAEHGAELARHALGFLACTYERLGLPEDEMLDALTASDEVWEEFISSAEWETATRRLPVVVWSRLNFDLAPYLSPRTSEGASLMSFFHQELADVAQSRYVEGQATHFHSILADTLEAAARGKDAGPREWKGSTHALAELPFHLTRAERWDDVFGILTDFTYLESKAQRVDIVTPADEYGNGGVYHGVLALMDDYDRALALFPKK